MNSVVGSLVYVKVRRVTEIFPPRLRKLWKNWELRAMVLTSLSLQIILISLGNRRKHNSRIWIRIVLWCAYLMADWIATVALGVILDNLGNVVEEIGKDGRLDPDVELTAFWAPFLLLHLGGPDTITAYSLEDNELWLRHLLGLGVETGVALYIFIMAWTGSRFSILSIPMLCAGMIKYGERTWALRSASNEEFRASMVTPADPGPNYAKFMQEYSLKQYEGFQVIAEEINEVHVPVDDSSIQNAPQLRRAYDFLQVFKRLFVDLILGVDDLERSRSFFSKLDTDTDTGTRTKKAFELIEMELGFVYDMLYTKARLLHSRGGWILRFISFSCTCAVLVSFSLADHKQCSIVNLIITYLLSCAAILLEVYAVLLLLSSDWTDLWCHEQPTCQKLISPFQLPKPPRWSNSMAQFSALSFYFKDKPMICGGILKIPCLDKVLEKYHYTEYMTVSDDLKKLIFDHLKGISKDSSKVATDIRDIISRRGSRVLGEYAALEWSVKVDFDQSILIWHIATYLCHMEDHAETRQIPGKECGGSSIRLDHPETRETPEKKYGESSIRLDHPETRETPETPEKKYGESSIRLDHPQTQETPEKKYEELSIMLSQYMLYLLVMRPFMLPVGIGMIRFLDTQAELIRFFEEYKSTSDGNTTSQSGGSKNICSWVNEWCFNTTKKFNGDESKACKMLMKVNTIVEPIKVKGDRSKSVLFEGCRLASQLQEVKEKKWEIISNVWVEMLAYAASQCRGSYHAQQLRRGGEFLSHVWLLMAHLGLTEQFQISQGHARVKLVVE
ncbi:uncharacterized protein LOC107435107 [Ziziphus jujuba]|uniref:Uncharacterized protein LOC107435107 n=1 Tax=Ziziphus jujuba TaxID=326968 RepID=A0ABM4A043_ZIZJJ|nr:uncharacterized protein LOC107435107 [Ziziphus jujuba]